MRKGIGTSLTAEPCLQIHVGVCMDENLRWPRMTSPAQDGSAHIWDFLTSHLYSGRKWRHVIHRYLCVHSPWKPVGWWMTMFWVESVFALLFFLVGAMRRSWPGLPSLPVWRLWSGTFGRTCPVEWGRMYDDGMTSDHNNQVTNTGTVLRKKDRSHLISSIFLLICLV